MNIVLHCILTFALLLSVKNLLYIIWRLHFDLGTLMRQNFCIISLRGEKRIGKNIKQILFCQFSTDQMYSILYLVSICLKENMTCKLVKRVKCIIDQSHAAD